MHTGRQPSLRDNINTWIYRLEHILSGSSLHAGSGARPSYEKSPRSPVCGSISAAFSATSTRGRVGACGDADGIALPDCACMTARGLPPRTNCVVGPMPPVYAESRGSCLSFSFLARAVYKRTVSTLSCHRTPPRLSLSSAARRYAQSQERSARHPRIICQATCQ